MCGIWGISYGPNGPDGEEWTPEEFMQIMFPAIVHRGPHAYGWMYLTVGGEVRYQKHEGRCDDPKALARMVLADSPQWLVGHVRYATHGSPTYVGNNHPILHGDVLGVHNGVLRNHQQILTVTGRQDEKAQVDSEAIFAAVNKWGHRPGLNKIKGDMVTVYCHMGKPETLHVARTMGRTLYLSKTASGSMLFASEDRVMAAAGIKRSESSPLSTYRLIRLREGKVRSRIDLDRGMPARPVDERKVTVTPVFPRSGRVVGNANRRDYYDGDKPRAIPAKNRVNKMMEEIRARALAAEAEAAIQDRNLREGDVWNGLYYADGRLMPSDEYVRWLEEKAEEQVDRATQDDVG